MSQKEKENVWDIVTKEYNNNPDVLINRSKETLKRCYENKKKVTRKQAANAKLEINKTGGGGPVPLQVDPTYDMTLEIINKKTVEGLKNPYDCDDENIETILVEFDMVSI